MKKLLFFFLFTVSIQSLFAQKFKYSSPGLDTIQQNFIVGSGVSTVLKSGQTEVLFNSTLASYWIAFHENGNNSPVSNRIRNTNWTSEVTALHGISYSGRFNIGLKVRYTRSRLDEVASSSPFRVFGNKETESQKFRSNPSVDTTFAGLSHIGISMRFKPFVRIPELVLTGGYLRSTVNDDFKREQLQARDIADIGLTYYRPISNNVFYFFGAQLQAALPFKSESTSQLAFAKPLYTSTTSFYLVHMSKNKKIIIYPGLSYSLSFKPSEYSDQSGLLKTTEFLFAFASVQYAMNVRNSVSFTAGFPLISEVTNPQIEIVGKSYSLAQVIVRSVF